MEVYLYRCEVCKCVICIDEDHGRTYYVECCGTCRVWTYYEKVVFRVIGIGKETHYAFYAPTVEECKSDSKEETETHDGGPIDQ